MNSIALSCLRLTTKAIMSVAALDLSASKSIPSNEQIDAAAEAWLTWQFPGRTWNSATSAMKDKFRAGAKIILSAAMNIKQRT